MAKKNEKTEEVGEEFAEEVVIEMEDLPEEGESWTEEFVAAGEDVVKMVKQLVHETAVRRVVVKNEERNIHLSIPLALGVPGIAAGIMMAPFFAALALIAALMVDCTITVERVAEKEAAVAAE
ncbi:MAG: DUF4342 domain-containing protein [Chloroflexi bacterium]|nr:DUF4342 domain-containing protein [Chloroflexota bacterium]